MLASQVKAALMETHPVVSVESSQGAVTVYVRTTELEDSKISHDVEEIANQVPEVKSLQVRTVHTLPLTPYD